MPNWCENSLSVIGSKKEINRFYKKGTKLDEDGTESWSLKPYYPYPDGEWDYDWCVDNWGTKWDIIKPHVFFEENKISICFLSAWAPPVKWLKKIQSDYPDLSFKLLYLEPGMNFTGIAYTKLDRIHNTAFIYEICEECKQYINSYDKIVTYIDDIDKWVVVSTGEVVYVDEHEDLFPINHFEDYQCWFEK